MHDPVGWPTRDLLALRTDSTPDRTAIIGTRRDERWTYRQLDHRVDGIATRLRERAETPTGGACVGLLLSPSPAFVATLHAAWRLGWTVVGLNTTLSTRELTSHVRRTQPDVIVYEKGASVGTDELDCPTVPVCELCGGSETAGGIEPARWHRNEMALVLFTSGTTGEPKGVRLTMGNLVSSAVASAFRLGVSPGDRWLGCLPVYHMGGLASAVRTVLYGTTLVLQREFDESETASVLDAYGITGVSLVPTQLRRLLDHGWTPTDPLETVLLGGAPASESLVERAREVGVPVYPTYGLTETASQVATALPAETGTNPGTVGQPLISTDVTVLSGGEPVESGERGEIVVDGPTVTPGYLDDERTDRAFGEWGLHTGDVGYRDDEGRLWIVGRRDEMVITGGELVAPAEVTAVLENHPDISDAAVVGIPDDEWGERVVALVVPDGTHQPESETLREYCRTHLAGFKVPKEIVLSKEVPRTPSGTIDHETVKEKMRTHLE